MKDNKVKRNSILKALEKHPPQAIYFNDKIRYVQFIEIIVGQNYEKDVRYSWQGVPIVYWDKNVYDLIANDYLLKELR